MENITHQDSRQAKYSEKNPVAKYLVQNFFSCLTELFSLAGVGPDNLCLEVGCGEGEVLSALKSVSLAKFLGCDIDGARLDHANAEHPGEVFMGSAYELPFISNGFQCVVCCEVLEHLQFPEDALEELSRVSSNWVLLSVPNEPLWRVLNVVRGKYWADLGNTPGHINHWSRSAFIELIDRYFEVVRVLSPLPWTMLLARKRV